MDGARDGGGGYGWIIEISIPIILVDACNTVLSLSLLSHTSPPQKKVETDMY